MVVSKQAAVFAGRAPAQTQRQPGPGKKFVTTPFGPIEVDISDPRPAVAVGPPLEPTAAPQAPPAPAPTAPALTAPAPGQAAVTPGQADQDVPVRLDFDNSDLI